jgi:heat-inducible transcriptional repressor
MSTLTHREIDVLKTIVEEYIASAQPVGSRTVAKKSGLRLSPASIRNTMADLTEKGFLEQPHTSAGRAPTVDAFRFYLSTELRMEPLDQGFRQRVGQELTSAGLELTNVLNQASRLISSFSHQVSMILSPSRDDVRWREIDFSLIKPRLVLAVLVLEGGIVQNKLIQTDEDLSADDMVQFANYLNDNFRGLTLHEARQNILAELKNAEQHLKKLYSRALVLARLAFEDLPGREVFVDGAVNMFDHVEFSDIGKMRDIMRFLEERGRLLNLLDRTIAEKGIKITFGQDAEVDDLRDCTVVSAPYGGRQQSMGVVGVIGPMRMNYAVVVPVVDYVAKALTSVLKKNF